MGLLGRTAAAVMGALVLESDILDVVVLLYEVEEEVFVWPSTITISRIEGSSTPMLGWSWFPRAAPLLARASIKKFTSLKISRPERHPS